MVGGGIGGTAAAYFLREKFGRGVRIEVLEREAVGGRLATLEVEGEGYEAGGSVLHPLNLHMKHFVKELGEQRQSFVIFPLPDPENPPMKLPSDSTRSSEAGGAPRIGGLQINKPLPFFITAPGPNRNIQLKLKSPQEAKIQALKFQPH